jgi:hypothetical protein
VSKTLWSVLVMGLMSALLLTVAMMFGLSAFQQSPAGARSKLGEQIRTEFSFAAAGADVQVYAQPSRLNISYETHQNSRFDVAVQNAEMQRVAEFAIGKVEPRTRVKIEELRVVRTEVHGRGCFQQSYVSALTFPNAQRSNTSSGDFLNPQDPPRR